MRKFTLLASFLVLFSLIHSASAATILYWDPTGTTNIGGNAIWNTTAEWSATSTQSASLVAFANADIACFSAGPTSSGSQGSLTVTINRTNTCAGIDNGTDGPGSCFLTLSGGATGLLQLAGTVNTGGVTQGSTIINVPITNGTGNGAITFVGPWTCTLNGTNLYTENTTITSGTLALGATGSISNSPQISIGNGATFDVSAISTFNLSSSTTLKATGSALPATIIGGTTVNFGSQPILFTYDGTHPSLTISQGALSLHGNAFTINKSIALAIGTYTIIHQASGSITSSGTFPNVLGTAIPGGAIGTISVNNGDVILTVANTTTTTLNALSASTYGQSVTFTATVAPTPTGGTVQFYDNGVALGTPVAVSGGTASYTTNTLSVGSHPITASYGGTTGYAASSTASASTQQVNLPPNNTPVTIGATLQPNGTLQMNFAGVAGYTYLIQVTTSLTPPITWVNVSTNTADINGQFNFTDTNTNTRYYQTAVQQ